MPNYLAIDSDTTLSDLNNEVGRQNAQAILDANGISRVPNIGKALADMCSSVVDTTSNIHTDRKLTLINNFTSDSDVFEHTALQGDDSWKVLSTLGTFPGMLKIPDTVKITQSASIMGNGVPVTQSEYNNVTTKIKDSIDVTPTDFAHYTGVQPTSISATVAKVGDGFDAFKIPWGEIVLYSSLIDEAVDFPVYPETLDDSRTANYTTMPDLLYQFEPWQLYTGSGPRSNSYVFKFHRDMWSWDHTKQGANHLIRFCEANCYAQYKGSAVHTPIVSLYVHGDLLIRGILTRVSKNWEGPIGQDGWYLMCTLTLDITEVSNIPLNFDSVRQLPLIG